MDTLFPILEPLPGKLKEKTGLLLAHGLFDSCTVLNIDPLDEALGKAGPGVFYEYDLFEFKTDLKLSFYQRIVLIENTGSIKFSVRRDLFACSHFKSDNPVYVFRYFDHHNTLVPAATMGFHIIFHGRLVKKIYRCLQYDKQSIVTLSKIITAPDGTEYYPGEKLAWDLMDAWERQKLREKLERQWDEMKNEMDAPE